MTELDARVAQLKRRASDAAKQRHELDTSIAVARDRVATAEAEMRREFDVSPDEAPARIKQLEADLTAELERAERLLTEAEEKK